MIKKERNSSIELLRIIAMIMIVFHHFSAHGEFDFNHSDITIPYLWNNLITMGGKIGVNLFMMISGYYLVSDKREEVNIKKLGAIWSAAFFYSVLPVVILMLLHSNRVGVKNLVTAFFPISFSKWWFITTYFLIYLLHPYINVMLTSISKRSYQRLIVILLLYWSVIPTFTTKLVQSNPFTWCVTLYIVVGYLKLHNVTTVTAKWNGIRYGFIIGVIVTLTHLSATVLSLLSKKYLIFEEYIYHFYGQEKIPIVLISLLIFLYFINKDMICNKYVNSIASAAMGVYLIHDQEFIKVILWRDLFHNNQFQNSIMLIPYSIMVVAIVYMACTVVELIRLKIWDVVVNEQLKRVIKANNFLELD